MYIIDTPSNIGPSAKRLVAAGVSTAFRYESKLAGAGWKTLRPGEARAFADAGLHMAIVYEDTGRGAGYRDGYSSAQHALGRCEERGQPDGSAIYYAGGDYDASIDDVNGPITEWFKGIADAHAKFRPKIRVGSYASGLVNNALLEAKLISLRWVTCSLGFRGSRSAVQNQQYEVWQNQCDSHFLGIDVDYNTARVADYGQFLPFGPPIDFGPDAQPHPVPTPSPPAPHPDKPWLSGKGSWYSQFSGMHDWSDDGDEPNSNALGVPDYCQGISFYDHESLGKWFEVRAPNGNVLLLQQTDIGPSPYTGRKIDISAVAAERFGYSPGDFPTNGEFAWRSAPPPQQVASLSPRQQAIKWLQIRQAGQENVTT